jgi:hypothetical protein
MPFQLGIPEVILVLVVAAELPAAQVVLAATGVRAPRPVSSRERVIRDGADPARPAR